MRSRALAAVIILLLLFPLTLLAQHKFKFEEPVTLVKAAKEPRPQGLDIAWNGSVYGIVYDDFWGGKSRTGSYFMVVDKDGKVLFGPKRLSSKQQSSEPKIKWIGDSFAVLHNAGTKSGNNWILKNYIARYSANGKKLSEHTLAGIPTFDWCGDMTRMAWTGTELGVFYVALSTQDNSLAIYFARVGADGVPTIDKEIYSYYYLECNAIWDGSRFIYLGVAATDYEEGEAGVPTAKFIVVDRDGNITNEKKYTNFAYAGFFQGVSIVPLAKKNTYLIALGVAIASTPPPAEGHWYDVYTTPLRIAGGQFSGFAPKNVSYKRTDSWTYPTLMRDGNKLYILSMVGNTGCDFAFAKMNTKGRIRSTPLEFHRPRPSCGAWPPYPAWAGKECGVIWVYNDLLFNVIQP
jgi:hypothetical protein